MVDEVFEDMTSEPATSSREERGKEGEMVVESQLVKRSPSSLSTATTDEKSLVCLQSLQRRLTRRRMELSRYPRLISCGLQQRELRG